MAGPPGRIIAFYGYLRGVGRSLALVNLASLLAANGLRVLMVDWDLEAPGLHRFFHPFLETAELRTAPGVIDMITDHQSRTVVGAPPVRVTVAPYAVPLRWPLAARGGGLDLLHAGAQDGDYIDRVAALDWDAFFRWQNGGAFLRELRADMAERYDYVLIDTGPGMGPSAFVCALQMPDDLIFCLGLHPPSIVAGGAIARRVAEGPLGHRIRILPVLTRVDSGEKELVDEMRSLAQRAFEGLPPGMTHEERVHYWGCAELPESPFYSYQEMPALFAEQAGVSHSMLSAVERIADLLTDGRVRSAPAIEEETRLRVHDLFGRGRRAAQLDDTTPLLP
ncbi:MinD/ParA family protein [Streptomyces sp. NPDC049040]|uniref:MinD/ParA family ATP-binding protein n=1 Tax=Streptomyces sp. NPDC049040 TaxID=3365593 RepID=UPI00371DE69E